MTSSEDEIKKEHIEGAHDDGYKAAIRDMAKQAAAITEADKRDLARRYSVSPYTDLEGLILEVLARWGKK